MALGQRTVIWTQAAREQLDEIIAYVAEDSRDAALKVLETFLDTAESLARHSSRGRVVPEIQEEDVREVFVYSYRLIYEVDAAEVRILIVIHGARDFAAWLERQGNG